MFVYQRTHFDWITSHNPLTFLVDNSKNLNQINEIVSIQIWNKVNLVESSSKPKKKWINKNYKKNENCTEFRTSNQWRRFLYCYISVITCIFTSIVINCPKYTQKKLNAFQEQCYNLVELNIYVLFHVGKMCVQSSLGLLLNDICWKKKYRKKSTDVHTIFKTQQQTFQVKSFMVKGPINFYWVDQIKDVFVIIEQQEKCESFTAISNQT